MPKTELFYDDELDHLRRQLDSAKRDAGRLVVAIDCQLFERMLRQCEARLDEARLMKGPQP